MRLLQKYILIELLRVFTFVVSALTVLLVFVGAFSQVSERGLGPGELLQILPYLVPSLLPFTIPATMLLTVVVVYGRIAADHEVTAAKAAGISALSLLWPSFVMGLVLSLVSLLLTDQVIPWAMTNIENRVAQMMEKIFLDVLRTQKWYQSRNPALTITVVDMDGKKLIRPVFRYTRDGGEPMTVLADEAGINFDLEKRQVRFSLVGGHVEVPNRQFIKIKRDEFSFPLPAETKRTKAQHCSIRDLRTSLGTMRGTLEEHRCERDLETAFALATGEFDRLHQLNVLHYDNYVINNKEEMDRAETAIHSRFALSASCFFFALLGGPFSVLQARRQVLTSFFICFVPILVGYYPVELLMMNLSKTGVLNPAWAVWVGNALVLGVGWVVLRKVLQH